MIYAKANKGASYLNDYSYKGVRQFNTESKMILSLLLLYNLVHRHCLKSSLKALQANCKTLISSQMHLRLAGFYCPKEIGCWRQPGSGI